jgi:hypothetical protein
MSRLRLLHGVDRERAYGIDGELVDVVERLGHGHSSGLFLDTGGR